MAITPITKAGFWAGFLLLFIGFIWLFKSILTPFILGITIAYLLNPVVRKFSYEKQIPRWVTALIILILFFAILGLLFVAVAPMAFRQGQMLIENFPTYVQDTLAQIRPYLNWVEQRVGTDYIEEINNYFKDNAGKLFGVTGGIVGSIASGGVFLVDFATTLVITPLVAFFMMKEWPHITKWVEGLYPRQYADVIRGLLKKIDGKVSGFIRGQIIVAFLLGMIYAIALSIAGLDYGFLIGIGAGLFSIIPLVGSTLGLVVGVVVSWFQAGDPVYTAIIAAIFMAGQFIEGNFLSPKVVGDNVGLHPLWVMFALLAGGSLFGILGMLLAVPVAAVVGVLVGFGIDQYKLSSLYQKEPEEPVIIMPDDIEATMIILEERDV
ncbi:MAG: AI-2E family transporter [Micavibrio aeruginosavorus]|uniref:AI-2E family transporter n=1 Tax=Micavibrio aeruginosavorus TaxID=349221 RepID=A0A2W5N1R2_9BACT|nr:MAG: AI-2E family transporter [Micavibrio aeruginosavorus]